MFICEWLSVGDGFWGKDGAVSTSLSTEAQQALCMLPVSEFLWLLCLGDLAALVSSRIFTLFLPLREGSLSSEGRAESPKVFHSALRPAVLWFSVHSYLLRSDSQSARLAPGKRLAGLELTENRQPLPSWD